jgi:hypothetical protein
VTPAFSQVSQHRSRIFSQLLLAGGLLTAALASAAEVVEPDTRTGETLYAQGYRSAEQPLQACIDCHRRSALGSSEGRVLIPAINGAALDNPRGALDKRLYQQRATRPGYDASSFAQTLRSGVDPAGKTLHPLMPRYPLTDDEAASLYAYLHTLSTQYSPGVDDEHLHLATVVVDGADPARRDSMLDIFRAFTAVQNRETRGETKRAAHAPYQREFRYTAHRRWQLHEWQLSGPAADWPRQLQEQFAAQPVFALIGGLGASDWQPIHDFCNAEQLACLFPLLDTPPEQQDFYSLYLSRGIIAEAEVLAESLTSEDAALAIVDDHNATARTAAERFVRRASQLGLQIPLQTADACRDGQTDATILVVWGNRELLDRCAAIAPQARLIASASLSFPAGAEQQASAPAYADRLQLLWRNALASKRRSATLRVRHWMRAQQIPPRDLDTELDSYFAITAFADAQRHIWQHYYANYLIERLEHMVDNSLLQPSAAQVSLAPGQRFLSNGAYSGRYDQWIAGDHGLRWITPNHLPGEQGAAD